MSDKNYEVFFENIKLFKEEQQKQKQRGLNDYNLLTTVLKPHDEVRLHSRVIGSLLDPNGLHYQDTLFLEKFLEIIDLKDFELNLNNITVGIEYHDIDLYITDGSKHIIIENKIWAEDQPCQIIKYINIIKEKDNLKYTDEDIPKIEDIRVVYLTPRNKDISDEHEIDSDGYISFSGNEQKLEDCSKRDNTLKLVPNGLKNYKVLFKKISYQKEILNWIIKCNNEVKNITNLNEATKQYMDVVKMIINKYEGKVMELSEELKKEENFKLAYEVHGEFSKTCVKLENDFWNNLIENIKNIDGYQGIENKRDKKIQEELDESIIMYVRNSNNVLSEVNLHFKLNEKVMITVGADNNRDGIYLVVFKTEWKRIDKNSDEDNQIIESIDKIEEYNFQQKYWCYGTCAIDDTINLRNEKLINANKNIDELAKKIKSLIVELKEKLN